MSNQSTDTVLIVDDEASIVDLYSGWLNDVYTVQTAMSGQEALARIDESIDVVLLDRKMPDLSGREVLKEIRERDIMCRVAMVTAVEPDVDVVEMGFDDYLTKPVNEDSLRDVVKSMLTRTEYDDQLQEYFALISKHVALKTSSDVSGSERAITELQARLTELENRIDDQLAEFTDDDYKAIFSTFPQGPETAQRGKNPSIPAWGE